MSFLSSCQKRQTPNEIVDDKITILEYLRGSNSKLLKEFEIIPAIALELNSKNVFKILLNKHGYCLVNYDLIEPSDLKRRICLIKNNTPDLIIFVDVNLEEKVPLTLYLNLLKTLKSCNVARISFGEIKVPALFSEYKDRNGKNDALEDIKEGKLIILMSGLPTEWFVEYAEILSKEYQIEIQGFGCIVSDGLRKYIKDYNSISTTEIERKYGTNILSKAKNKAIETWRARQPE